MFPTAVVPRKPYLEPTLAACMLYRSASVAVGRCNPVDEEMSMQPVWCGSVVYECYNCVACLDAC